MLVLFEDLHWGDPTTLEFLELLLARLQRLRVLLVITHRPEFQPDWTRLPPVTTVALDRLNGPQTEAVVARVAGGKPLPAEIVLQIVAKTGGVPLFVEELTKAILESGIVKDDGERYTLAAPLSVLAIPNTLRDSLMARLDRLSPVKEVAQIGACIGREFGHDLLSLVSPIKGAQLDDALAKLVDAELVFRRESGGERRFVFKHGLVQDVAYDSLLKSKRALLHAQIAQVLERDFGDRVANAPELLAHHLSAAGAAAAAIPYWYKAATNAVGRVALFDAMAYCSRGLALLKTLPDSRERTRQELALQLVLARAASQGKGWTAPEAEQAFARARTLCEAIEDAQEVFAALWGVWSWLFISGRIAAAQSVAQDFLERAQRSGDSAAVCEGQHIAGQTALKLGDPRRALAHYEEGIGVYDAEAHRGNVGLYGQDSGMANLGALSRVLWVLGYPDRARQAMERAMALVEHSGRPFDIAWARFYEAVLYAFLRDWTTTGRAAEQAVAVSTEHGFGYWLAGGSITLGLAQMHRYSGPQASESVAQQLEALRSVGAEAILPWVHAVLAQAYCELGRVDDGLVQVAAGLALVEKNEERWIQSELHRVHGELMLGRGTQFTSQAEACFDRAAEIARHQQARAFELRSVTSLARLWQNQGKRKEAHDLLAPVCNWFTEGFDTQDLKDAKAVLETSSDRVARL